MPFIGRRRDQVVTIQENVLQHLSPVVNACLLRNFDEKVWPESRNIPIREVEDQLLELAQHQQFRDIITLETSDNEAWNDQDKLFQIIVGADGSMSKTRELLFKAQVIDTTSTSMDTALGIAFQVPEGASLHGLPFEQDVNCIFTIAQRRYLLNASRVSRSGYLNIQLSIDEMKLVVTKNGNKCNWSNPGFLDLSNPNCFKPFLDHSNNANGEEELKSRRLWSVVVDGMKLFGIRSEYVANVIGIELPIRYATKVCFKLENDQFKRQRLGFLIGDAAFQTHFWPGRGLNSALKGK